MSDWPAPSSTTITTTSELSSGGNPSISQCVDFQPAIPSALESAWTHCPLLALPTEMRLDIYELALLDDQPTASSLRLLQTCRHIRMEAGPTLYKRPTSFTSQARLFALINRSRKQDLKRVRTLTLRLTDIDLSSLLDQSLSSAQKSCARVWSLYQQELESLDEALRALPNLSSLTIVPPTAGRSLLLKGLYHTTLALIPKRCPKLQRLEIQDGEEIVQSVPALLAVKNLTCTGTSERSSSRRVNHALGSNRNVKDKEMEESAGEGLCAASVDEEGISPKGTTEEASQRRRHQHAGGDEVDR